jgi:hypothetical protein
MDQRTRAATYEDVLRIVELLDSEGAEYALIGGYALAFQGIVRLTEDVDILVAPSAENAQRWVRALARLPDRAAAELLGDETLHTEPYAIRINDAFTVDVMNSASGFSWEQLKDYRVHIDGVCMVSLQGLLLMKQNGRPKDLADAAAIRRALSGLTADD